MTKAEALAAEVVPVLAQHAGKADADAAFPHASVLALREAGLFGLLVPAAHGGMDGDLADLVQVATVLAGGCLSTAMIWAMHCQQVDAVVRHADDRLRAELLPRIAQEGYYLASVTTEPAKGGHLLRASAALLAEEQDLVVRRSAPVVTGGEYADGFLVTMRAGPDAPPSQVSLVHLDRTQVDAQVVRGWDAMGMRATRSVGMELSGVAAGHQVIGPPGGFRQVAVDSMIPAGHLAWSSCWIGAARRALDELVALLRSKRRPGGISVNSDLVRHRLARVRIDLEVSGTYLLRVRDEVLRRRRTGTPLEDRGFQTRLNTLKVVSSELTFSAVDRLVQLAGAMTGYLRDAPVPLERFFRDLRSASLNYSNDRLLDVIGAHTLLDGAGSLD
ncbi:acyl-CoA dehydrogenase family protein [Streptomyces aurantiacus]|uniref:Putative Short/branched chain specific acyl-CoA dehydrogenase n=1 Tax=Streptomyces aurantiacus JA 4570 TaxID=1286094 RepID=S4AUW6_9ACTN|nr:acyl-CoA dehydrogenase family protein [Streptomyces aurantiacus]EPH45237.1 putative Short/branched chain specific acyl-CoA dehydrogenase [Streptomyces aurantiacus JA 4570]